MTETTPPEGLLGTHPTSATLAIERIGLFEHPRGRDTHQPDVEVAAEVQR